MIRIVLQFSFSLLAVLPRAVAHAETPLIAEARMISDRRSIRAGETFKIGVHVRIPPGAHMYWINPGDGGLPTRIQWQAPSEFEIGPTQWPIPARFVEPPLISHGYADEVVFWATVRAPGDFGPIAAVRLTARIDWLLCRESCVPGGADLSLVLRTGKSEDAPDSDRAILFEFERRIPREQPAWRFLFTDHDDHVVLYTVPPPEWDAKALAKLVFIPEMDDLTEPAAPQEWRKDHGRYVLRLPKTARRHRVGERLEGVLREGDGHPRPPNEQFMRVSATHLEREQ